MGKPMPPQLLRCKGFAVKYYPPPYFGGHPLRLGFACPVKCEAYFTGVAPSTFATGLMDNHLVFCEDFNRIKDKDEFRRRSYRSNIGYW
jgi:hypothetical protein